MHKKSHVAYIKNLNQVFNRGLKLKKVHQVVRFDHVEYQTKSGCQERILERLF